MSSNAALRCLVLAGSVAALACGHKASPFPPPLEIPARVTDLTAQQRGASVILRFSYPQMTVAGELLAELDRIEVWAVRKPVNPPLDETDEAEESESSASEEGEPAGESDEPSSESDDAEEAADLAEEDDGDSDEPELSLEEQTAIDQLEFDASAQLLQSADTEEIERALDGSYVVLSVEFSEISHEEWSHTFAVRSVAPVEEFSAYSNLATLVQRIPPAEPTDFQLTGEARGIRLAWSLPEPAEALRVYRRSSQSRVYGDAITTLDEEAEEHLDTTAEFGERYIYAVTAVGQTHPLVESFFGGEREIDYADRFAPAPPTNLIALAEEGRVRLLWDASTDDDVRGYIIFRREPGADFRRLTEEPIVSLEYSDRAVLSGTTYDYRIAAIDAVGNQGEQGSSVIAQVP